MQKHRAPKVSYCFQKSLSTTGNSAAPVRSPGVRGAATNHQLSTGNNLHFWGRLTGPNWRRYWKLVTMRVILASFLSSIEVMEPMKEPLGIFA